MKSHLQSYPCPLQINNNHEIQERKVRNSISSQEAVEIKIEVKEEAVIFGMSLPGGYISSIKSFPSKY